MPRTFAFLVFKNSLEKSLNKDSANQQLSSTSSNTMQTRHGTNASVQAITVFNFAGHIKIQLLPRVLKLLVKGRNNSQHCCANSFACCCVLVAVVFNRMQQLPTTRNKMQHGVQTDATCSLQQCCVRLLEAFEPFVLKKKKTVSSGSVGQPRYFCNRKSPRNW